MLNKKGLNPFDVDRLLAEGKNMAEIGRELGFSRQAVSMSLIARKDSGSGSIVKFTGTGPLEEAVKTTRAELRHLNREIKAATSATARAKLNRQRLAYLAGQRQEFELVLKFQERIYNIEQVEIHNKLVMKILGDCDVKAQQKFRAEMERQHALQRSIEQA